MVKWLPPNFAYNVKKDYNKRINTWFFTHKTWFFNNFNLCPIKGLTIKTEVSEVIENTHTYFDFIKINPEIF